MAFNVGEDEMNNPRKPYFSKVYTTTANIDPSKVSSERFIAEEDQWKAAPFDSVLVTNLDVVDLNIRLNKNPDTSIAVRQGMTIGASDQEFRFFDVENLSSTTAHTAGKVRILVQQTRRPVKE